MDFEETTPEGYQLLVEQIRKITEAMNEDQPITVLTETSILLQTLTPEYTKTHKLEQLLKTVEKLLNTTQHNRILRINQRIKEENETAIEYYDENIGTDHRLYYQHDTEKLLTTTYSQIRTLISTIIKNKLTEGINLT